MPLVSMSGPIGAPLGLAEAILDQYLGLMGQLQSIIIPFSDHYQTITSPLSDCV